MVPLNIFNNGILSEGVRNLIDPVLVDAIRFKLIPITLNKNKKLFSLYKVFISLLVKQISIKGIVINSPGVLVK